MELNTERLMLRNFSENDAEDFYEYFSNPTVMKFEPFLPFTMEQAIEEAKLRVKDERFIAVCLKNGKLIGNLYFSKGDFDTYELGYVFNDKFWGNGYALESVKALMEHAFVSLKIRRLVAHCDPKNAPSWKLLERVGMRREGTLFQNIYFFKDDEGNPIWKDTYEYGLLQSEYINR